MSKTLFLTGATGFLGRELLKRYLLGDDDLVVAALVRGKDQPAAQKRLDEILTELFADQAGQYNKRVEAVCGDITKQHLGLEADVWKQLAGRIDHVVHGAASVAFDMTLEKARAVNVVGSQEVLALLRNSRVLRSVTPRLDYIGTAYVAGDRKDLVLETELDKGQGFRNSYEQSKLESERHVRAAQEEFPITIYRPSIIMGDSRTGATTNFNVIYWPIRIYAKGWWNILIGNLDAPLDVVPVDWVADAIHYLSHKDDSLGACYHLAAGPMGEITVGTMARLVMEHFDGPALEVVSPEVFWKEVQPKMAAELKGPMKSLVQTGAQYMGYFEQNPHFDVTLRDAALADAGLPLATGEAYFNTLLNYCKDTDWGRRPPR